MVGEVMISVGVRSIPRLSVVRRILFSWCFREEKNGEEELNVQIVQVGPYFLAYLSNWIQGLSSRERELVADGWEGHCNCKVKPFIDVDEKEIEKESEKKGDDAYETGKKSLHREGMR